MTLHCPHCGSSAESYFRVQDVNRRVSVEWFDYYRCDNCRLIFLANVPTDLGNYYPSDYYVIPESAAQLAIWAEHERYKMDIVQKFVPGGRLLEIGPASGGFALMAKQAGFEVEVIEMNRDCCDFLSRAVGVHAIHSASETDALEQAADPDVIALWHVIEHLPDPWTLLKRAAGKLRPGGILILASPNPEAFQFGLLGSRWVHIDAPRHLALIPRKLIVNDMLPLGLTSVLETTTDKGSLHWNVFGWKHSFANLMGNRLTRYAARGAGRLAAGLFWPVESREGRGSAYTLVLRKETH
jgi:2-polyprenyl-3-methyl-5-hydroxy-6-metoxy-1,4-benzoquinol methylase